MPSRIRMNTLWEFDENMLFIIFSQYKFIDLCVQQQFSAFIIISTHFPLTALFGGIVFPLRSYENILMQGDFPYIIYLKLFKIQGS